ncbi:MAG: capsule assembly Wzi family protein [Terriglobia bacterium]
METNVQAGRSHEYQYRSEAHSAFAILRRRNKTYWAVILRLLGCALGLVLFQSVVAWGEIPLGSVYVPLDSWVYAAFDRLAGLGTINKQFVGLRPWTRLQCAQLVLDADENLSNADVKTGEAKELYDALNQEFSAEIKLLDGGSTQQAGVESLYTRTMGMSGAPLRDGYHFGQTIANDFGRPFNTGFNNVTGFSAQASRGRFYAYIRGEYQHSPAYAGLTAAQQSFIEHLDETSSAPYSQAARTVNQLDLLDAYVGVRLWVFDVTVGKQSLWWGPGTMGPMLVTDNIDPIPMLRVDQVEPIVLPGFLKYLGPVRIQGFFGKLYGQYSPSGPPGPYFHGEKALLKPTPNWEIGFSKSTVAFGQGVPFTLSNLFASYFSITDSGELPYRKDPGSRQSGMDFSYRVPYLRKWLTVYTDNYSKDDLSPLVNPLRAKYNPGFYLSQIPHLPKFDFRFEFATTGQEGEQAYWDIHYFDAYTNKGFLIGDTVGRWGKAFDVSSTYWHSPRKRVQVGWREQRVSKEFIPNGGAQDSVRVKAEWFVQKDMALSILAQHERWSFPFLATGKQSDNVFSLQYTVYPKKLWARTALRNFD